MTTAEFIIGHSADDAAERKKEARKILWALLAALGIHLLIGYSLAVFGGLLYSPFSVIEEDKPVELTFVDLATPAPVKNAMFIPNDESKQTEQPKEKTFESNANSIGASEMDAAGELPLPSQTGKDRPLMDFETNPYSLETKGAQPQQSAAASQQKQMPAAQPAPMTAAERFALLTQKPASETQRSAEPSQAQSAYRRLKERTQIAGNITNRGISAVNALGTPLGRYQKIVADSIGSRWYAYVDQKRDLITIGTLRLRFNVDRSGRVKDLKITENSSNEAFANVCVQSVLEAHLPPIPEDVADTLPPEGLEVDGLGFIIFPNG